jgi:hypothetical protein
MQLKALLNGGAPVIKSYQINATVADVGVPLLVGGAGEAGLDLPSTTAVNDMVGVNLDTATYVTSQQTDGSTAERTVKVIINPDAIYRARLSGDGTTGTALTLFDITTATTDGLDITTGDDWNSTDMDEGLVWGYDGANVGQIRKITSTTTLAATVTVAFENDHQVGDNFLRANFSLMDVPNVTLTSDFQEIDTSVQVASNVAEFALIDIVAGTINSEGTLKSFVDMVCQDHVLNQGDG